MAYNLNFHQTFKPEKNHISSLLSIKNLTATKEELSHQFGIPTGKNSGKVEVSLLYAQAAKLLNFSKKNKFLIIERTQLGECVFENDEFLEHELTQLLFHYMFCSKNSELALWELLFTKYHRGINKIDVSDFIKYSKKSLHVNTIKLAPLWGTFISDDPLIDLGVLRSSGNGEYIFGKVNIIKHYVFWYAFFLYDFLGKIDSNRNDFTLEEILSSGFHNIFGWDSGELRDILELIESMDFLTLNKQFHNYHIYLNKGIESLLSHLDYI